MRNRHFPRLCGSCQAPLARQEHTCWRCGAHWRSDESPAPTLHVMAGVAPARVAGTIGRRVAWGAATQPRAATPAGLDVDRWTGEGGSVDRELAALVATGTARR
jgi:hypothetical protein